jgi:hypothetical protein
VALLSLNLPVIGQSSATEDQKVRDALAAIQTQVNGNLDATNITAAYAPVAVGAFSAYRTAAQSLGTGARVDFDTEEFDVSNWLVGGVYTPQVAGYYRFSWNVGSNAAFTVDNFLKADLFKNGVRLKSGQEMNFRTGAAGVVSVGCALAQANGTTDAFDIRITHNQGGTVAIFTGLADSYFQGELVGR